MKNLAFKLNGKEINALNPGSSFNKSERKKTNVNLTDPSAKNLYNEGSATYSRSVHASYRKAEDPNYSIFHKDKPLWPDAHKNIRLEREDNYIACCKIINPHIHDALLNDTVSRCNKVSKQVQETLLSKYKHGIKLDIAGGQNNYPCVNIAFDGLGKYISKLEKISSVYKTLIPYFIGYANYLSNKDGLGFEMTQRSSFGFNTPSISECGTCLRINLGLTPDAYSSIIVKSIVKMNDLVEMLINTPVKVPTEESVLRNALLGEEIKNKNIALLNNKQLTLISLLTHDLYKSSETVCYGEELFRETTSDTAVSEFAIAVFKLFTDKANNVTNDDLGKLLLDRLAQIKLNSDNRIVYDPENKHIEDLDKFDHQINSENSKPNEKLNQIIFKDLFYKPKAHELPELLKQAMLNLIDQQIMEASDDTIINPQRNLSKKNYSEGFGSDSELELDLDNKTYSNIKTLRSAKFTAPNGMNAINQAYHAISTCLIVNNDHNKKPVTVYCENMYYETKDFIKKSENEPDIKEHDKDKVDILIQDLNTFHSDKINYKANLEQELNNHKPKYVILDDTSATHAQVISAINLCFEKGVKGIVCVSSGMKNQQAGTDLVHFGTARIFINQKGSLKENNIYKQYKRMEEEIKLLPPEPSKEIRQKLLDIKTLLTQSKKYAFSLYSNSKQTETETYKLIMKILKSSTDVDYQQLQALFTEVSEAHQKNFPINEKIDLIYSKLEQVLSETQKSASTKAPEFLLDSTHQLRRAFKDHFGKTSEQYKNLLVSDQSLLK